MIFVVGTRAVASTEGRGRFHCPQCGEERDYERKSVRRFFALFSLPLVPLERVGRYVECAACESTFVPEVLEGDPGSEREEGEAVYRRAARELMVRMLLADGRVADAELDVIGEIHPRLTGEPIERARIEEELERARERGDGPLESVAAAAPLLNDVGKEALIRAAIAVAGADGHLATEEREYLGELAGRLELSEERLREILHGADIRV